MEHKNIPIMAVAVWGLCFFALQAQAKYGGGTGEPNDPYRIATAQHLNDIDNHPEDLDKNFLVIADIDLSQFVGTQFNIIGKSYGEAFTGVFDGNDHVISNFTYTHPYVCHSSTCWNKGLFGFAGFGAHIKNTIIRDANIYYLTHRIGVLVGSLSSGTVSNCRVENASLEADEFVGGLVGLNDGGTIKNSYADAYVVGSRLIGGLVGVNDDGSTISRCFSTGDVKGTGDQIGGLLGLNDGMISNCYSMASVRGGSTVGGLVGRNRVHEGNVEDGIIFHCYSTGTVSGGGAGGLIGTDRGNTLNSYWDVNTSCISESSGGFGRTTEQMKQAATYVAWGDCEQVWTMGENDYPRLWWENKPGQFIVSQKLSDFLQGTGTPNDPYRIYTAEELNLVGLYKCEWDKHFLLMRDIDLSDVEYNIIGLPFYGVFDGRGHKISNFTSYYDKSSYIGIFGRVDASSAQIKNLRLANTRLIGDGENIGSLIGGLFNGTVSNCHSENARITGHVYAGGLVGRSKNGHILDCHADADVTAFGGFGGLIGENYGQIERCYSHGSISGTGGSSIGGLAGLNRGFITNCYSMSSVYGFNEHSLWAGGFVGYNKTGAISDCYSTGSVNGAGSKSIGGFVAENRAVVNGCFWDIQTSDCSKSQGGYGKTTQQMKQQSTFTQAGWDFTTPIWTIKQDVDYPKLWKENTPPVALPGPNQIAYAWIDNIADVDLDGLDSYDIDGDNLSYYWSWTVDGITYEAIEPNPTFELPIGEHQIQLIVNDGIVDSDPNYVTITVIEPIKSHLCHIPKVISRQSNKPKIFALVYLPESVTKDTIDSDQPLRLYPGNIKSIIQRIMESRGQGVRVFAFFDKAELMLAVPDDGTVELKVVGQFKTGQYFYGTETVKIVSHH